VTPILALGLSIGAVVLVLASITLLASTAPRPYEIARIDPAQTLRDE